ncbi:RNA polymerase sigma factor [Candidatus Venteria ishoeyi]|uniref:ECF RNA polymerase sigma factor SigW n=1 Tax=Candidatus Venteria ishoeyi TaxID=1899563 RepID=A0A1H6F8J7_9GAMM|nr:sigma-70 family RNA polymerase sigma factor [Candidatus Venteria ishoeyi]SEH05354.1 ECF RNA polymerase sigma factor SigW [Candidatus Venteria ishoeyi]
MTDLSEIIDACKRDEELARKILYEQTSTRMRAICFRYLGNKSDTEDVLHESFIIVFTKIKQFEGKGSFEGWMKRIFINNSLRFLKDKRKAELSHGDEMLSKWEYENADSPLSSKGKEKQEDLIRRMEFTKEELMEVLQTLPEGYRLVFNLFIFEKHGHKEIAKLLSISENTSKSQLNRARKYIQQKLYKISIERAGKEENDQYKQHLRVVV